MRALHVIPSVAASEGGPAAAIRGMTAALADIGVRVTVATTDADGSGRLDVPLDRSVMEGGVAYRYFSRTIPGRYSFSWPLARWLDEQLGQGEFDVVHVHGVWQWTSVAACRIALRHRVPYILRTLGMLDPWSRSVGRWKKAAYYRAIERAHLHGAAAIHTTAAAEADGIAALGFGDRVHVIPLGVSAPPGMNDRRPTFRDGPVRLVFLARLHPKKGLPLLLEAMEAAVAAGVDLELTVAGGGDPGYVHAMRQRAAGLGARVRFTGHVDGERKWDILREADLFVLPSSQENFGISVAEAMTAAVPVVISDQVAIAPAVRDAGAGLVVPLQATALRDAICVLASDPSSRVAMGERARAFAQAEYSWPRCATRVRDMYEELTSPSARRGEAIREEQSA